MEGLLKEGAYRKLVRAYGKLGRALKSRERLGYDAIFKAMAVMDSVMTSSKSWEYPATQTRAGRKK